MTSPTAPQDSTLYDIIPPPRAPLTPSIGFWLLVLLFAAILWFFMTKRRRRTTPSILSLLADLLSETKSANDKFIIENASRISRLLRRAGGNIYERDLSPLSAIELKSILAEKEAEDEGQPVHPQTELLRFLITLEELKYGEQKLSSGQSTATLTRSLEQILMTLSKSRRIR